jgi:hypothetical protein
LGIDCLKRRNHFCNLGVGGRIILKGKGAPKWEGGGLPGCSPPNPSKSKFKKNTHFVDVMISNVLRVLPFSRNQTLK